MGRSLLRGIRRYCDHHPDVEMVILSNARFSEEATAKAPDVDGLIIQHYDEEKFAKLQASGYPIITTSNRKKTASVGRVLYDDHEIGRMGAIDLLDSGFRTLAFIEGGLHKADRVEPFQYAIERRQGFVEQVQCGNTTTHLFTISKVSDLVEVVDVLRKIPGPIGVMAASDLYARWFIEALPQPRRWVPEKFGILGVDNDPQENALCPISLSSVHPAGERLGYEAAAQAIAMAQNPSGKLPEVRVSPSHLVTRASTNIYSIADDVVRRALKLIRERLNELRDVSDVVRALHLPRRTLEDKFRKSLGRSLAEELNRSRIRRATELLGTTSLSIKQISFLVGFSEPRLLSRNFRKLTGETPGDYRQRVLP